MDAEEPKKIPSFYAVIPSNVRYDKDLKPNAKLLYGEITALTSEKGYCWATNDYFAQLYGVNKKTISTWITQLKEKGYIKVRMIYKQGTKEIEGRYITINIDIPDFNDPIHKKMDTPPEKNGEGRNKKMDTPIHKKMEDINTSIINTSINTNNNVCDGKENPSKLIDDYCKGELNEALKDYYKMRIRMKKPMTNRSVKMLLKKLDGLASDEGTKLKIVEQSIERNYLSVFEIKGGNQNGSYSNNSQQPSGTTKQHEDDVARALRSTGKTIEECIAGWDDNECEY